MSELKVLGPDAEPRAVLQATRDYLADPEHWIKGTSMRGDAMCLGHTVFRVLGGSVSGMVTKEQTDAYHKMESFMGFDHDKLVVFNDSNLTTHAVMLERLDRVLNATAKS